MRKKIFILLLTAVILLLAGNLFGEVKKGEKIKANKVVLVGKVIFEPEIKQEKNILPLDIRNKYYIVFLKDEKTLIKSISMSVLDTSINNEFNKYFIGSVKNDIKYLRTVTTSEKTQDFLYFRIVSKLNLTTDDRFLYVGDLHIKRENDKTSLMVVDNYEEAKKIYDGYINDLNGKPVKLDKKLLENDDNVRIDIIMERTQWLF
jgi:hypothetical protein